MAQVSWSIMAVDKTRAAFASVNQSLRGMRRETEQVNKQFMSGLVGGSIFALIAREVREVSSDIDNIPGVPADTVQSVKDMTGALTESRNQVRGLTADLLANVATGAKSIGATLGAINWKQFIDPMQSAAAVGAAQAEVVAALDKETQDYIKSLHEQTKAEQEQAAATKAAKAALEEKNAILKAGREGADAALKQQADGRKRADDYIQGLKNEGEAIRKSVLTPNEEYAEQLERLEYLKASRAIGDETYFRRLKEMRASLVDTELTDFFGDMDQQSFDRVSKLNEAAKAASKSANELGWAFSSAFEDAILEGGKLRDILQGLAKDILRILIRNTITEPLAAGISGGIKGIFAGGKAQGGAVMPATTYLVGENGPELFTPSAAGRIIPNHNISSEGSAGGNNFTFNYSFPMGVTKAELIPALQATKAATIAAFKSMQVRSARAAYA